MAPTDTQDRSATQNRNVVAELDKAEEKISNRDPVAPSEQEIYSDAIVAAGESLRNGADRETVAKALQRAADDVSNTEVAGPMSVIEVASGGGVIGHYDRNPVDSVVDTGTAENTRGGSSEVVRTAEVATPGGDSSEFMTDSGSSGDDEETEEDEGYAGMTNADLSAELENRGLAKSGTKDEMIARLEEDDANK